jgi:hypothetical protein
MNFEFDIEFFDKFVFHGCQPEFMSIEYLINAFTYNENLEFDNDKINIWYVRDDIGCNDFVYNNNLEAIEKVIPKQVIPEINNNKLILILSTESEWQYDDFWRKIIDYCESIGIDKNKINIMNSNIHTKLPNSYPFTFSSLPCPTYDLALCWMDKYPDFFPYTDTVVENLKNKKKDKRYICLNAHYQEHRHYVVYKLFEKKLQDMGYISFTLGQGMNYTDMPKKRIIFEWNRFLSDSDYEIKDYDMSIELVDKLPINLEREDFWEDYYHFQNPKLKKYVSKVRPQMMRDPKVVSDTYFCIANETLRESDNGNMCTFSEKTMLGWVLQPTIIVGTPGIVKHLKNLGFESYDELFDESYDEIIPTNERLLKVMDEVERVCRMPESELKSIYNDLLPKVRHNQNKLFEYSILGDWKDILGRIISNE